MRFAVCAAAVVFVALTGARATSAHHAAALRDRTTTDMPDDIQGPQVHFMYVIASDDADGQLDTNGAFEQSIERIQHWMLSQTGNQGLRIDTYRGVPDITFLRMPQTDSQATSIYPWPLWTIGEDLVARGFNDPNKVYAVFYDGHSTWACGGAKSPALPKIGAMYLQGWPTHDPAPCHAFGTGPTEPGYFDLGLLHEVMHAIGYSTPCAVHKSQDGFGDHVNDSPTDLMYAPDAAHTTPWDVLHAVLDFNHDDYYRAHIPGCLDLADSPYLTPMLSLNVATLGSGTVSSSPSGISCSPTCSSFLVPPVTLTATPGIGQAFKGWGGSCSGTASTCTLNTSGSVVANFAAAAVTRSLSLRVQGRSLIGSIRAAGSTSACVAHVAVAIQRRAGGGWTTARAVRTGSDGVFVVSIPKRRADYRAVAAAATVGGLRCTASTSPVVAAH
jgi:List-Bact-rpt repeat protein